MNLTDLAEWHQLKNHHQTIAASHMRDWFQQDPNRQTRFSLATDSIFLDYSRNRIVDETLKHLFALAEARQVPAQLAALFRGDNINTTEKRPALHMRLRDKKANPVLVNGIDVRETITNTQTAMKTLARAIESGAWCGKSGKPFQHIINIGIGGSFTGPLFCLDALAEFATNSLKFHFISSIDPIHVQSKLKEIDPETALFIISSKSFTTIETLTNAETVLKWVENKLGYSVLQEQVLAVTAAPEKAVAFGIPEEHILTLWDWVGGRYSVWSAIGLPLLLMLGEKQYQAFLDGAHAMDEHVRTAPLNENLPVILALLGIWYINFFEAAAHAIIPYAHRLRYLIPYLQQADMESNGKRVSSQGEPLTYATGPIVFGEEGVIGQHAYHQLLHQGQHFIPADLILVGKPHQALNQDHQAILLASALSQANALMRGKTTQEAAKASEELAEHLAIPGNKPCQLLYLSELTPYSLGALVALYEHKIFIQGAVWGINSFDQWGVELGKQLLPGILNTIQTKETSDPIISRYQKDNA